MATQTTFSTDIAYIWSVTASTAYERLEDKYSTHSELQYGWGLKGPLEVTQSNPAA